MWMCVYILLVYWMNRTLLVRLFTIFLAQFFGEECTNFSSHYALRYTVSTQWVKHIAKCACSVNRLILFCWIACINHTLAFGIFLKPLNSRKYGNCYVGNTNLGLFMIRREQCVVFILMLRKSCVKN